MKRPAALRGPVLAMARPKRPVTECAAVIEAASGNGSAAQRARRLADRVAAMAIEEVNRDPADDLTVMLRVLEGSPAYFLATDPEINTARLVSAERCKRLEARGGRRLPERDWHREDADIQIFVSNLLAERYRRFLTSCSESWEKPVFSQSERPITSITVKRGGDDEG